MSSSNCDRQQLPLVIRPLTGFYSPQLYGNKVGVSSNFLLHEISNTQLSPNARVPLLSYVRHMTVIAHVLERSVRESVLARPG